MYKHVACGIFFEISAMYAPSFGMSIRPVSAIFYLKVSVLDRLVKTGIYWCITNKLNCQYS